MKTYIVQYPNLLSIGNSQGFVVPKRILREIGEQKIVMIEIHTEDKE